MLAIVILLCNNETRQNPNKYGNPRNIGDSRYLPLNAFKSCCPDERKSLYYKASAFFVSYFVSYFKKWGFER